MSSIITSAAGAGAGHRAVGSLVDTTVGRQPPPPPPPQVEDVAEDGDGMRVPGLELSPVSSEASFESDTDDKQGSEVPKTPQTPASPAMSHSSDLDCPYYLSQAVPQAHPTIPGLTRMGFVKWMTINILAYPDQESRRFALLLPDLAPLHVIGPDGAQECLPYTLPRNLFPATHDKKVRRLLDEAMLDCLEDHDVSSPLPAARSYEVTPVIAQGSGSEQGRFWGRANFEASGVSTAQRSFVTLPPPPVGQHSTRAKSPVAADRCSASVPNMDRFADAMNLVRKGDTGIVSRKTSGIETMVRKGEGKRRGKVLFLASQTRRNSYQDGQGRRDAGRRGRF
ncbi:predicted protein [Verticillium alfalfae VaMs.102]|uniref:Predicted protein n=1 Tax=Verticillium alfalfae (strain VaMs.102 / ATCC MYA-4576 / FGSC 10136) TaxID=526221 RepID=C9SKG2_VERA1|nr:predicted protein [Verticillium alfalfae VaMs.102]EEY19180.1 predicted protein [Verticillium alfalfae VaMs.102]